MLDAAPHRLPLLSPHPPDPGCRPEGLGVCLNASALFVPSYSLALRCDACDGANTLFDFRWRATNESAAW